MTERKKLIEVSLPLEEINRESSREKSIRHGHPSTLHLWWARRPLAAARAVLFAQLVDDPSSHPDRFPTEEDQRVERERLHDLIRRLVVWENVGDERLLAQARAEIVASAPDGVPPAILDPFAGGGTIPLEAQRLGLEAHASDLNPAAVLINKALIEIPPVFAGRPPVYPGAAESRMGAWPRATGLAEDVRRYGAWMRDRAQERIGHLYPDATLPDGSKATVIAWIWARTVTCPNPACGIEMPLVRSWWLGKKKGKEAYVLPEVVADPAAPSGKRVAFTIGHDVAKAPTKDSDGTMAGRSGAVCLACGTAAPMAHIKAEGIAGRLGAALMAVVAKGSRRRVYLTPSEAHAGAARVARPDGVPDQELGHDPRNLWTPAYGLTRFSDLFTNRQLVALTTFSDLVAEARDQALADAQAAGMPTGDPLHAGGTGAAAYADAVATYLALVQSKITNVSSSITTWMSDRGAFRETFARQALPMTWDFAEQNPVGDSGGGFLVAIEKEAKVISALPVGRGKAVQADAATRSFGRTVLSTDPPYYDNIGYSDLSDFFYVWLRRTLRDIHPQLFSTMLVPKAEELVANPYRHGGVHEASTFFEEGFEHVFARARESASDAYPITVFYAFKQTESTGSGIASTGWSTILEGMIRSGWVISATWPMRTEGSGRIIARDSNALASSIVLALRPRKDDAPTTSRRGFVAALRAALPQALTEMQQADIAPVDLAQATIGPGMAVFSRYSKVVEADGSAMSVQTALTLINQALDEVLAEQDGDLDADTRFCLAWYGQYGWTRQKYGFAEDLARAQNVAVDGVARGGVLTAREGWVTLTRPADLPAGWDPATDDRISVWEVTCHLARALTNVGVDEAARLLAAVRGRPEIDLDAVQRLAYRLYELAQKTHPADAGLFNALGTEWKTVHTATDARPDTVQDGFDLEGTL